MAPSGRSRCRWPPGSRYCDSRRRDLRRLAGDRPVRRVPRALAAPPRSGAIAPCALAVARSRLGRRVIQEPKSVRARIALDIAGSASLCSELTLEGAFLPAHPCKRLFDAKRDEPRARGKNDPRARIGYMLSRRERHRCYLLGHVECARRKDRPTTRTARLMPQSWVRCELGARVWTLSRAVWAHGR